MAMTRETKIGLLVGLAFIILFGIILSEKGTTRNEEFATPPITAIKPLVELVPPTTSLQPQVAPEERNVVDTKLTMTDPEVKVIEKIVPPGPSNLIIKQNDEPQAQQPISEEELSPKLKEMLPPSPKRALSQIPASNPSPEAIVIPAVESESEIQVAQVQQEQPAEVKYQMHEVEAGETLAGICRKYYPGQAYNMLKEVMAANDISDPKKLRSGQTLKMPLPDNQLASGEKKSESSLTASGLLVPVGDRTLVGVVNPDKSNISLNVKATAETKTLKTYTVQDKDTLTKIAKQFYGSEGAWTRIYEMNKGILKNPHALRSGINLKLPASELAVGPKVD
jgi:nucleoid-associated protein YgaU